MKYISRFIDHIGLWLLHRDISKESHFKMNLTEAPVPDERTLEQYYPAPGYPNIKMSQLHQNHLYKIFKYTYPSQIPLDEKQNDLCSGLFYESQETPSPVHVIFVHGWRMDDFKRIENIFLRPFQRLGYNMYFFTLPYHHERAPIHSLYNGELMISADIDRTLWAVKQAVTDLRALIQWIKKNRGGKIILIGTSLGGFIANLASVVEEQIDILVSIMYANSIAYSIWHTIPGKYIRQDLEQHGFTYNQLRKYWAITDPSLFQPKLTKDNILLLSGKYDQYVLSEDTDRLWEAWNRPKRILYPCGHAGIVFFRKRIRNDVITFIKNKLE